MEFQVEDYCCISITDPERTGVPILEIERTSVKGIPLTPELWSKMSKCVESFWKKKGGPDGD